MTVVTLSDLKDMFVECLLLFEQWCWLQQVKFRTRLYCSYKNVIIGLLIRYKTSDMFGMTDSKEGYLNIKCTFE